MKSTGLFPFLSKSPNTVSMCFLLVATFILSACSTVKIASIEKRRYQDGYYVKLKQGAQKTHQVSLDQEMLKQKPNSAALDNPSDVVVQRNPVKDSKKKLKTAVQTFKRKQNTDQLLAVLENLVNKAAIIDMQKDQASIPKHKEKAQKINTVNPLNFNIFGTGESAIVLLVVLAVLLLILMKDVLLALLFAVLFALVILWMLRELDIVE